MQNILVVNFDILMPRSVPLDDLQYQHLVVGNRELGQCEYRTLPLVSAHDSRVVAYA